MTENNLGSFGNLIQYFQGPSPIEEKLKKSHAVFFIELDVFVEHKEELVLTWLTDLLVSNKVFTYSENVVLSLWELLDEIFSSKRLKTLCSKNLIRPLSSTFSQTLLTTASNITTPAEIKEHLFSVCRTSIEFPTLSPQIARGIHHLYGSLVSWLIKDTLLSPKQLSLLNFFLKASWYHLHLGKLNFVMIFEKLAYPTLYIYIHLEGNENEDAIQFRETVVEIFIPKFLFSDKKRTKYETILSKPLEPDVKTFQGKDSESFYYFLINCIESSSTAIGSAILKKFFIGFFNGYRYKKNDLLAYQLIVNTIHLLGISIADGPAVVENSVATLNMSQTLLDDASEGIHLVSILEAVYECNIDTTVEMAGTSIEQYLQQLSIYILKMPNLTKENLKALSWIVILVPTTVIDVPQLLPILISQKSLADSSFGSYDQFLCEMLHVYNRMRKIPDLYCDLSKSLMPNSKNENLVPSATFLYKGIQLLPPRFIQMLMADIYAMGTQMSVDLIARIEENLRHCVKVAENSDSQATVRIIMTVWLSSRCLSAVSLMEGLSSKKVAKDVATLMSSIGKNPIKDLVTWYLSLKKREPIIGQTLLNLILVWNELHIKFLTINTGYNEKVDFQIREISTTKSALDFSAQAPFIESSALMELVTVLTEDNSDESRLTLLQMIFQKVFLLLNELSIKMSRDDPVEEVKMHLNNCLDFVFSVDDRHSYEQSTDLLAVQLLSLEPFLTNKHRLTTASLLASGYLEESETWTNLTKSLTFKKFKRLQSSVFSVICHKLHYLLSGSKRKAEEMDSSTSQNENKRISRQILDTEISIWDKEQQPPNDRFHLLEPLLKSAKKNRKLGHRSESEILSLLRLLESFPVYYLPKKLLESFAQLLLVVSVEEGINNGRPKIVSLSLKILNRVFNAKESKQLLEASNWETMIYFVLQEVVEVLGESIIITGPQLSKLLNSEDKMITYCEVLEGLLSLFQTVSNSFCFFSSGENVLSYAKHVTNMLESSENKEAFYMAVFLISRPLKNKAIKTRLSETTGIDSHCVAVNDLAVSVLKETIGIARAKMTSSTIAACLSIFTDRLSLKEEPKKIQDSKSKNEVQKMDVDEKKENEEKKKENEDKEDLDSSLKLVKSKKGKSPNKKKNFANKKIENTSSAFGSTIDWVLLVNKGIELSKMSINSGTDELKQISFFFLVRVVIVNKCYSYQNFLHVTTWQLSSSCFKSMNKAVKGCMIKVFEKMPITIYRNSLNAIVEECQRKRKSAFCIDPLDRAILALEVLETRYEFLKTRNVFCVNLLKVLPYKLIGVPLKDKGEYALKIFQIFNHIFQSNLNAPGHTQALVFFLFFDLKFEEFSLEDFIKIFNSASHLLQIILEREDIYLVKNRVQAIVEIIYSLSSALMERSKQSLKLEVSQIRDLERCANDLDVAVQRIKKHAINFMNMMPFLVARIAQDMQKLSLEPALKAAIERIIFLLFKYSYPYGMQHVMVALPPSVTSLMKHLHHRYSTEFKYTPIEH